MEDASRCTETSQKLEMYSGYRDKFPRAQAPQRLPLDISKGDEFRALADKKVEVVSSLVRESRAVRTVLGFCGTGLLTFLLTFIS